MEQFAARHIGPRELEIETMAQAVGFESAEALVASVVPETIKWTDSLQLPAAYDEAGMIEHLRELGSRNQVLHSYIGLGYYGTHVPSVILRNILENPAWYTAYTPYQPEISQGRLEALLNFQTMICELTRLDVASASLLDEPTAAAEAMTLMKRAAKSKSNRIVVDVDTHPQTLAVMQTRANPIGIELVTHDFSTGVPVGEYFGVLLSYPGSSGEIRDLRHAIVAAHEQEALVTVTTDLLALQLIEAPGRLGADVAIGSAQRFGVPMGFGGPHAGFMSVHKGLERSMPGRLVGVSVDNEGNAGMRLALSTREQHIRREKATSNICTAQVLLAVMSGMYAVYHGPEGLKAIASRVHSLTSRFAAAMEAAGFPLLRKAFFDTVQFGADREGVDAALAAALAAGFNLRRVDDTTFAVAFDETTTDALAAALLSALGGGALPASAPSALPLPMLRASRALKHPIFDMMHSETQMMRYLRNLADKDLALDRTMIPLGSCTMKLNAATEMEAVSWPEFANLHPFAPLDQAQGTLTLIRTLEQWLVEITGYDYVTVQPNAGSQGEFAGLLAIGGYHRSRGEGHRDRVLIPASAHGTNPASAVMAGMRVVVVATDDRGNVDLDDLRAKIAEHRDNLAALMITYPSTHGVFEAAITDICAMVHDAGGQVYVDGANLNALVALAKPGRFGADVSHLNLHKTFSIPHGGGGPGVGPIGVRAHLAPFLPSHPIHPECGPLGRGVEDGGIGPVSGAPWGSAGVLQIPYAYIGMMGAQGLREATRAAIVSANYIAKRLDEHFPVLYKGESGLVAHECIVDVRPLTHDSGVTVDDIAKRLMDAGFHAPTMSFPVAGTLMIEPTESEPLAEIERFIDAMIAIRREIQDVIDGRIAVEDSPLRHAPHTARALLGDWDRKYTREQGAYPTGPMGSNSLKYFPPVGRIDGAYGDRNLVCTCPEPAAYAD
ncbi:MAG: aminomethyl-transferring glycine dehydrogenase [Candidatus Nanopelagicales bacterium]